MTTHLTFKAPEDLSVGHIRLQMQGGQPINWISTPNSNSIEIRDAAPGVYTAIIDPLGLLPRSFVFEVKPGEANNVAAPSLSVLANVAQKLTPELVKILSETRSEFPSQPLEDRIVPIEPTKVAPLVPKQFTVGLAVDTTPRRSGGWVPVNEAFAPSVKLIDGGLDLVINRPADFIIEPKSSRIRLSIAIERSRIERMMIPLFKGGVRIAVRGSPLSSEDISIRVVPVDNERRALTQALSAGVVEEAKAVTEDVLGKQRPRDLLTLDADPWAMLSVLLLGIRFPSLDSIEAGADLEALEARYEWIADVQILLARRALVSARQMNKREPDAAREALVSLGRARRLGAPYFAYANEIRRDILASLLDSELGAEVQKSAHAELKRWNSQSNLKRIAGAAFSWSMSGSVRPLDPEGSRKGPPQAPTRGTLDERYARIVFKGQFIEGRIIAGAAPRASARKTNDPGSHKYYSHHDPSLAHLVGAAKSSQASTAKRRLAIDPPALDRPVRFLNDLSKGRFGGRASRKGYTLSASFTQENQNWVFVTLVVTADPEHHEENFTRTVDFFLHDSFEPQRMQAVFRGHKATLQIRSWGGFTVGAWIAEAKVELELDLAKLDDAPRIVRDL
jgi:hypothetical protein